MGNEENLDSWLRGVKSQEWYPDAKRAKLALTEAHGELKAREELFVSQWTTALWKGLMLPARLVNKRLYNWLVERANPIQFLERGAAAYLDTLRVERYLDGLAMLKAKLARGEEVTAKDRTDIADMVNTLTGRASLGPAEVIAPTLTKVFFSPRLWSSAVKTATPYAFHHFGLVPWVRKNPSTGKLQFTSLKGVSPTARKLGLQDMGRFIGLTMGIVSLAALYLNGDDDDDDENGVEFDSRSSDFMKIKIGNVRIDPWGGKIQQVIFTSRIVMGMLSIGRDKPLDAYKNSSGELLPLGVENRSPTLFDVGTQMALNKLAPSASLLVGASRTTLSKDRDNGWYKRSTVYGDEYSFSNEFLTRLYPIYFDNVAELSKEDNRALAGFLMLYSFLGYGTQSYESRPGSGIDWLGEDPDKADANDPIRKLAEEKKYVPTRAIARAVYDPAIDAKRNFNKQELIEFEKERGAFIRMKMTEKYKALKAADISDFNSEMEEIAKKATIHSKSTMLKKADGRYYFPVKK